MTNPLRTQILRPGMTRSVLEAKSYAEIQSCPNCGGRLSLSDSRAARPADGGVWEVVVDCHSCGSILRYLFDAAPAWTDRADTDPDTFAARFGPEGTISDIFGTDDLRRVIDATLPNLKHLEADLAASKGQPSRLLRKQVAQWALRALRALREMQAQGIALSKADEALMKQLEAHEAAGT